MVGDAVITAVQHADEHTDGFEVPLGQGVARVVQHGLVQGHVTVQGVRAQAVDLQHVIHLAAGAAD